MYLCCCHIVLLVVNWIHICFHLHCTFSHISYCTLDMFELQTIDLLVDLNTYLCYCHREISIAN